MTDTKQNVEKPIQKKGKPLDISSLRAEAGAKDMDAHKIWTDSNSLIVFEHIINKIDTTRKQEIGTLHFDKDDEDAVAFVTAASNLRAACFDISRQTLFETAKMAGNIVPAVATTNAVVSGLEVTTLLKFTI